jgi:hypothetical protein
MRKKAHSELVDFQLVAPVELSPTSVTLEQLEVEVAPLVVLFVPVGYEPLLAELALEWLLTRMPLDMVEQARAMLEADQRWAIILADRLLPI